jgi:hypothetical protein
MYVEAYSIGARESSQLTASMIQDSHCNLLVGNNAFMIEAQRMEAH